MFHTEAEPFVFSKFSQKEPAIRGKYLWAGNLSFVVHDYKCLMLKNIGTLLKSFLQGIM